MKPESIRGLLLTPRREILLLRVAGRGGEGSLWLLPGGRREGDETPEETLRRELKEEAGRADLPIGPELWIWRHPHETERAFLVETDSFEPTAEGMDAAERGRTQCFRWWKAAELAVSEEHFVPRRLGELVTKLLTDGPPPAPVRVEGLEQ
jgi:ADP-ribose pyrophosphatase YjhB (NUDIX family)